VRAGTLRFTPGWSVEPSHAPGLEPTPIYRRQPRWIRRSLRKFLTNCNTFVADISGQRYCIIIFVYVKFILVRPRVATGLTCRLQNVGGEPGMDQRLGVGQNGVPGEGNPGNAWPDIKPGFQAAQSARTLLLSPGTSIHRPAAEPARRQACLDEAPGETRKEGLTWAVKL
jgi:hypothetical protein